MGVAIAIATDVVTVLERPVPKPAEASRFGFGSVPRPRRRIVVAPGGKSDDELIAEYLRHNEVKKGPPRFADGAVRTSGTYDF